MQGIRAPEPCRSGPRKEETHKAGWRVLLEKGKVGNEAAEVRHAVMLSSRGLRKTWNLVAMFKLLTLIIGVKRSYAILRFYF